jgi:hypothetical protein
MLGIAVPAYAQGQKRDKQDQSSQQQRAKDQAKPEQQHGQQKNQDRQLQAQQQQRQNQDRQQQKQDHSRQQQQRAQQQQNHDRQQQARRQQRPQRTQEQQRVWQNTWQAHRARSWQSDHRSWQQRGGYNGYRIPDNRYRGYFGPQHYFRIHSLPFMVYDGYPRFQYQGYWITLLDPWPGYWSNNWYDNDDVYINYDNDGYYMYNRRHPGVGIAINISM